MVFIQLRTKDVDMVDDRTGNEDDVGQEGIDNGHGHDGHGEESRPNAKVRLLPRLRSDAPKSSSKDVARILPLHRRKPLGQKPERLPLPFAWLGIWGGLECARTRK